MRLHQPHTRGLREGEQEPPDPHAAFAATQPTDVQVVRFHVVDFGNERKNSASASAATSASRAETIWII